MLIKKSSDILSSEITPKRLYVNRRTFLAGAGDAGGSCRCRRQTARYLSSPGAKQCWPRRKLNYNPGPFGTTEKQTPLQDITHYNNYYEFGTDKYEPAELAESFKPRPWTVQGRGLVNKPQTFDIDTLMKMPLEERVYRMRCVEGWSHGDSLGRLPAEVAARPGRSRPRRRSSWSSPPSYDPKRYPGQQRAVLDWPYVEGLRLDEAMNPLTMLAVGLYGETLPNQDGAPIRLVVPWKYGFKGIKAIVKIKLVEKQPISTWTKLGPNEYGFYSNVNPK